MGQPPSEPVLAFVAFEAALVAALVFALSLSFGWFVRLLQSDLGMHLDRVETLRVDLSTSADRDTARTVDLIGELLQRIQELPGVEGVGMSDAPLFPAIHPATTLEIESEQPAQWGEVRSAQLGSIDSGYFRALGIPLVAGRPFGPADRQDGYRSRSSTGGWPRSFRSANPSGGSPSRR